MFSGYVLPDTEPTVGFYSSVTGLCCYAGYLDKESEERGYDVFFAYLFDANGNPVAWSKFTGTCCLSDLTERGCAFRFDYLYGDAEAFGVVMESTNYSANYEGIANPEEFFKDMAFALESNENLFYNNNLAAIFAGEWVVDNCFPDSGTWLNKETYDKIKEEVDAWPDWKKQAYSFLG